MNYMYVTVCETYALKKYLLKYYTHKFNDTCGHSHVKTHEQSWISIFEVQNYVKGYYEYQNQ